LTRAGTRQTKLQPQLQEGGQLQATRSGKGDTLEESTRATAAELAYHVYAAAAIEHDQAAESKGEQAEAVQILSA